MASLGKDAPLERFHHLGLGVGLVIIAEQMQEAMDNEMGDMVRRAACLPVPPRARPSRRPARCRRASAAARCAGLSGKAGKDSTLVGLSLPRQSGIEGADIGVVGEDDAELAECPAHGRSRPSAAVDGTPRPAASSSLRPASRPLRPVNVDVDRRQRTVRRRPVPVFSA